jgi:hypothetical protein
MKYFVLPDQVDVTKAVDFRCGAIAAMPLPWVETDAATYTTKKATFDNAQVTIEAARPKPVPTAISNADLRRQIALRGINPNNVTAALNAMDEGAAKWVALSDWEYANYFERAHPLLAQLAPAFGLSSADVDEMFRACPQYRV